MSGSSTLILEVGEKKYEIKPAPLKMLKKIWAMLPKITNAATRMQELIRDAGSAEKAGNEAFMQIHTERIDAIVELLCTAAGIKVQEAEDNMTREQVEDLTNKFNQYLGISGFLAGEEIPPNGAAGQILTPVIVTPLVSTETGTALRPN